MPSAVTQKWIFSFIKKKIVTCLLSWVAGVKEKEVLCSLLNEFDVKL